MRAPIAPRRRSGPAAVILIAAVAACLGSARPAGAQERFRRTPPLPDAQRLELRLPPVETFVLPNGLTVATARRPESSLVTLQLVFRAGVVDSPAERPGLADVTARMIGKGTKMLSSDYIENMIESMGADFSAAVFMDYTVLTMTVLDEFLDRAVYILRLIALEAVFNDRELAAVRRSTYWEMQDRKKNPEVLGWTQLLGVLFENHPYRAASYSEEAIKLITARDVETFYNRFYRPGNAAVIVSGRIDGEAMAQKIANHFGAWAGRSPDWTPPPPPRQNARDRICYVENPDLEAATVFAGNVIMGSSDPDFYPVLVLKQVLGGTTMNRLFQDLRESKNYASYAFSEMEVFASCGVYWARARVHPESLGPAIREILGEIDALATGPAVPSEIEEAKSYLVGSLPLRFEAAGGFADWLARYVALGLGPSQWDRGPEEIKRIDAERVRAAARKYLSARPVVVVIGRPEWIALHLGDFDAIEVYDTAGQLKHTLRKGEGR